jgi:hypothetical protein
MIQQLPGNNIYKSEAMLRESRQPVLVEKTQRETAVGQVHGTVVGHSRHLRQRLQLSLVFRGQVKKYR